MENRIKPVFDRIQAEDSLKQKTKAYLSQKVRNENKKTFSFTPGKLVTALCALALLLGSCWMYHVPTASISVDINPSVELTVNCIDRVIDIRAYNDEGQVLLDQIHVVHLNYEDAVEKILEEEMVAGLLSSGEMVIFSVIGPEGSQVERIISGVQTCTAANEQTQCGYASPETAEQAHAAGISAGKYRVYLELRELDPDVTVDDIRDLTMRQIRDLMEQFQNSDAETTCPEDPQKPGHYGNGDSAENGTGKQNGNNGGGENSGNGYRGGR